MLIPHGTIVAIVDGAHFALLRNTGNETEPVLEAHAMPALDRHGHISGGHKSGHDPASQIIEAQHSASVVEWLNHGVLEHRIHDLIIVASPRTLGELRPHYHGQLKAALRREEQRSRNGAGLAVAGARNDLGVAICENQWVGRPAGRVRRCAETVDHSGQSPYGERRETPYCTAGECRR